jgi:uncharacterized protein YciI
MYIILIQNKTPDAQTKGHKAAHEMFLKEQINLGNFITAGKRIPNTGEVIMSCLEDIEALHNILNYDPYYKSRSCQYEIIEFSPEISCAHLEEFMQNRDAL